MTSTSAYTTILDLTAATNVSGSESFWIVQGGTDKRTTIAEALAQGTINSSQLTAIGALTVLANNSTQTAAPSAQTLTETFDANYGTGQNTFITRDSTGWIDRALVGADLPNPTTTTLGGAFVSTNPTNQWATGLTATGSMSYSVIPASQLVQSITGSSAGQVVMSSGAFLYNPGLSGGSIFYVSSGAGSTAANRPFVGQLAGYNIMYSQAGSLGLQIGSSLIPDATTYIKQDGGMKVSDGNANYLYLSVGPNAIVVGGSSTYTTTMQVSSTVNGNVTFPASTYTVVGTTNAGVKYQRLFGVTGGLPVYQYPTSYTLDPININMASTADNAISVTLPSTTTKWQVRGLFFFNNSTALSTAITGGFYTGAGGTGTTVVSSLTTYGMASTTPFVAGSMLVVNAANINTAIWGSSVTTIYMALTTPSSVAATVDLRVSVELFG